jgi:RNA polymerase sigma factor (sigma-70 family)
MQEYRKELRRIAWRIQYRARVQHSRELLIFDHHIEYKMNTTPHFSNLNIQDLLSNIPTEKGRYIIKRLLLDGYTEKEVAKELKISQQAVSKWKKKGLEILRKKVNLS